MKIVFCSSIYNMEDYDEISQRSSVPASLADHNLNSNVILGLEENIGCMFCDIGLAVISLNLSPQVRETKPKLSQWHSVRLKSFSAVKETINKP